MISHSLQSKHHCLDCNFPLQSAVAVLVDPVVNTEVGTWQRSFIIKTLLAQGNSNDQRSYGFFPY